MSEFEKGIYLETIKSHVGTGDTKSDMVYKNLYAARPAGEKVEVFLLNDQLELTGIREIRPRAGFLANSKHYPKLISHYLSLEPKMGQAPREEGPKKSETAAAPENNPEPSPAVQPSGTRLDDSTGKNFIKENREDEPDKGKTPWWEATRQGASNLIKK